MKTLNRRDFIKTTALTAASVGVADVGRSQPKPFYGSKGANYSVRDALTGPCASVRLPFDRSGAIDFPSLQKQIEFVLAAGSKSVILTRGDSLYSLLTDDEIAQVTKAAVKHVNHRALVVAADGSWATDKEVQFAKYCKETGVDMLMVLPPDWGGSDTVSTLVTHYRAVAEHLQVMVVTNYLGKKPMSLALKLIESLRDQVPGVVALKDDVGGEFARRVCLLAHKQWAIIAGGQQQNHMNMLPYGVDGFFSMHISFKPEIAWRYWHAAEKRDLDAAVAVIRDYDMPLFDFLLKLEGGFDAGVHGLLEAAGLGTRHRRPPYHSLTDEQMAQVKEYLRRYA